MTEESHRETRHGFRLRLEAESAPWIRETILPNLDRLGDLPGATRIKSNNVRTVYRVPGPGGAVFVKRYHVRGPGEWLKYLVVPSRATAEWRAARSMRAAGLPAMRALMMGEKRRAGILVDGCFASREIPDATDFIPWLHRHFVDREGPEDLRAGLLERLARLIRRFHDAGFDHGDLHSGNVLVTGTPKANEIHLIDLHTVSRRKRIGVRTRLRNLSQLMFSLESGTADADRLRMLEAYSGDDRPVGEPEAALETVRKRMHALTWRRYRSRTKRCLRRSSGFDGVRVGAYFVRHRRAVAPWLAVLAVGDHLHSLKVRGHEVLKDSHRSALSRQVLAGVRVVVKETRCRGVTDALKNAFRAPRAKAAWVNGNGLRVRGVGAALPLALVQKGRWPFLREGWILMEDLHPAERLDLYVLRRFAGPLGPELRKEKRELVTAFAIFLRDLHRRGIYHGDLKAVNVYVDTGEGGWPTFRLVDYDRVRFGRSVSRRRRIKNLSQLAASIAVLVTKTDRLRFFRAWAPDEETGRDERAHASAVERALRKKIVVRMEPIE